MTRIQMGSDESHFNVTLFVRVMEVGDEIDYTCRYTVITRMTLAFRWAATRALSMFH